MSVLGLRAAARLALSPRQVRRPTPAFSPAQLAGLSFWYDAAQSPVLETGGAVERWDDLSGNGNHAAQDTAPKRPVKTVDGEARATIRFDGADDALLVNTPPDLASGVTVFVIFRVRSHVDFRGILAAGPASGSDHASFFTLENDTAASKDLLLFGRSGQADTLVLKTPNSSEIQYALFTIGADTGAIRDLNGIKSDTTTSAPFGTPTLIALGARAQNGSAINSGAVDLYEVGLYPRVLSAAELDQLEAYLIARRGLSWNPNHIGKDLRWFHDAGASPFTLEGASVSQWDDLSGAARHFAQSGDQRPIKTIDGQGRDVVRFDGADDTLLMAGTLPTLEPFSFAVIYALRTRTDFAGILSAAAAAGSDDADFWTLRTATAASEDMELSGRSLEPDPLLITRPDQGSLQIAIWTTGSNVAELRDQNGSTSDGYDGGFGIPAEIVLGGRYNGAPFGFAEVDVCATVGVGRVLSSGDQQRLVDWALTHWGI